MDLVSRNSFLGRGEGTENGNTGIIRGTAARVLHAL
jgi:hypothetical protein